MTRPSNSSAPPVSEPPKRSVPRWLRPVLLLVVLLTWLGIAGTGGPAIGSLSSVQSNGQEDFLPAEAESVLASAAQRGFADQSTIPGLLIFSPRDADTEVLPERIEAALEFGEALNGLQVEGRPLSEFINGGVVRAQESSDGRAVLVVIPLLADAVNANAGDEGTWLDLIVEDIRLYAGQLAPDVFQVQLTGPAGFAVDLGEAFAGIDGLLLLVALLAVLIILLLVYRAVALPFIVLLNSVFALAAAGGLVYLLADADVLVLNGQSQGILFILVVGAATDYGLLLVARFREELLVQESVPTAVRKALRGCIEPILASGGTVIAGLLCLLLSDLNSNRSLGPVGAIGIACAILAAFTLLPILLLAGRWLFWPRVPHPTATHRSAKAQAAAQKHGIWDRVAALVARRSRLVWALTAIGLAACAAFVPNFQASGTAQDEVFLTEVESVPGAEQLREYFPEAAGAGEPVIVITAADSGQQVLAGIEGLGSVSTAAVTTGEDGAALVVDGRMEITAVLGTDGVGAEDAVREIRGLVHEIDPAGLVGGQVALNIDTIEVAQSDLRLIIPVVLIVVLLVLIALLRSLVAPLLLVAATVLSFGSALGVASLVFEHLFDFPGADPAVPLFAFVFLVALGVDYSIFLMSRAREEVFAARKAGASPDEAAREGTLRALRVTGGVITSAGVVLAATFAALGVIPLLFLAQIAFIVAFGVLLDTLIVRSLLVPAIAHDLGKRTWWPAKIMR